jgi:hypothetical protein
MDAVCGWSIYSTERPQLGRGVLLLTGLMRVLPKELVLVLLRGPRIVLMLLKACYPHHPLKTAAALFAPPDSQ